MASSTDSDHHHLLMFPFPGQGHINPFFNLALNLVSSPDAITTVSFLCTHSNHQKLLNAHSATLTEHSRLRFLIIPEDDGASFPEMKPVDGDGDGRLMVLFQLFDQFDWLKDRADAIERLLVTSENGCDIPFSCMIVDYFLPWTREMANHLGIKWCVFWTASLPWFCKNTLLTTGANIDSVIPGVNPNLPLPPIFGRFIDYNKERCQNMVLADCILFNTFRQIDGTAMDSIPMKKTALRAIGPLLPSIPANLQSQDMETLAWLDKQPPSSVTYVSFGSVADISAQQLQHLALGIEASGCRFLWVVRPDNLEKLPKGFRSSTNDRGCIVAWAPQLQVLKHPATALFFTHCGWNSVMESVLAGVPMLCMPFFADQFVNCSLVVKEWGIGLAFTITCPQEGNKEEIVEKAEIERVLRLAMEEETAKHLKLKSANLAELARVAIEKGGSSYQNMMEFLEMISTK